MKILFNAVDSEASGAQRVIRPLNILKDKYPETELEAINSNSFLYQLENSDLVVLQCLIGPQQHDLIDKIHFYGKKVVIDYDDYFDSLPKNVLKNIGMTQSEVTENWHKYLKNADLITVPNEFLAEQIRKITLQSVKVLPNLLLSKDWEASNDYHPFEDTSEIRIMYSCSQSHLDDFKWILPVLAWIGENYKNVRIISHGDLDFTYLKPDYKGKASHIAQCPYDTYFKVLREAKPHIMLAPLKNNMHAKCRSNLKFLCLYTKKC